ncbi:MAG: dUTP diphosphatase [Oscillospiraceae bacterium]|jgi:dUTP pyrophosphatase|nr:dUTP diphosphatase [Oscillospiraceae bacterium]
MSTKCLKILKKRNDAVIPTRNSSGAAGFDLYACINKSLVIKPEDLKILPSGIAVAIPTGFVGLLFVRSSLGVKYSISLSNAVGVIDSDYRGEILVGLKNFGKTIYTVDPGDRIAQMVIVPFLVCETEETEVLSNTARGQGGFGSTGR